MTWTHHPVAEITSLTTSHARLSTIQILIASLVMCPVALYSALAGTALRLNQAASTNLACRMSVCRIWVLSSSATAVNPKFGLCQMCFTTNPSPSAGTDSILVDVSFASPQLFINVIGLIAVTLQCNLIRHSSLLLLIQGERFDGLWLAKYTHIIAAFVRRVRGSLLTARVSPLAALFCY